MGNNNADEQAQGEIVVRQRRGRYGVEQKETERQATLSVRGQIRHGQSVQLTSSCRE